MAYDRYLEMLKTLAHIQVEQGLCSDFETAHAQLVEQYRSGKLPTQAIEISFALKGTLIPLELQEDGSFQPSLPPRRDK